MDFVIREYSDAQIGGAGSYNKSMEMIYSKIPVTAPKSMRDQMFAINNGQKVRIHGVVINPFTLTSGIRVKAERIETVQ